MNVANFIEEFTRLIIRWTSNQSPINAETGVSPLSSDMLLSTMQQVINATLGLNVTIANESTITTPAAAIVVNTPHAPVVQKIPYDQNDSIIQTSFDNLSSKFLKTADSANNSPSQTVKREDNKEEPKAEGETLTPSVLSNETKFISRSSPAVYISSIGRSDTFTCDKTNVSEDEVFNDKDFLKIEDEFVGLPEKTLDESFLQKLDVLRKNALDVVSIIDDLQKQRKQKNIRPIRRLSSAAGFPGLPRSGAMMRAIPPPKIRRSVSGISPGTPTSSRQDSEKQQSLKRAKSTSTNSLNATASAKLSIAPKGGLYGLSAEKSPNADRPAKNPKYAHVQSTIPKAGSVSRRKT